jgi:hypothetical protein
MDSTNLCNALRMEFEGVFENKIPLNAFPSKIQDMILVLSRQENYSIEYTMASLLVAVSTAIGNAVNIRIRGGWISNPALYMILVGRPGMGKTPPLDFAFRPIRNIQSVLALFVCSALFQTITQYNFGTYGSEQRHFGLLNFFCSQVRT